MRNISNDIIHIIGEIRAVPGEVTPDSHLYADLHFDSLSFIILLMKLEEKYSIRFDIREMESCLKVGALVSLVEGKTGVRT